MKSLLLSLFLFIHFSGTGQNETGNTYSNGIYYTLEDFLAHHPDTISKVRKVNLGVPTEEALKDTIVDHTFFIDKNNDLLTKVFAIVYNGEIYFADYGIRENLLLPYGQKTAFKTKKFHRVQERGRYFYAESNYAISDPTAAILLGSMFGALGGAVGGALGAMYPSQSEIEAPFIFDTHSNRFLAFHSKKLLQQFMNTYHPERNYEVEKGKLDIETVRDLFVDLNKE